MATVEGCFSNISKYLRIIESISRTLSSCVYPSVRQYCASNQEPFFPSKRNRTPAASACEEVTYDGQVAGDVTFGSGTYVGLGWGNAGDGKGFGMSVDLGIFQQGSPDLTLTASGPITDPTSPAYDPNFATDLQNEVNSAEKDLEDFQQYPVIALGITYGF